MGEQQEFKPSLFLLEGFDGKVKADYNEFTQYISLTLAREGKMSQYSGMINNQLELDSIVRSMLAMVSELDFAEEAEVVEEKPKKSKK